MNEVSILIPGGTTWHNVIFRRLITVGFRSYRVDLKLSRLVKFKLKHVVKFLVTEFTRHAVSVCLHD